MGQRNAPCLLSVWRPILFTYQGKGTSEFILDFDRVGNGAANQRSAYDLQPGLSRCLKQHFGRSMGKKRM